MPIGILGSLAICTVLYVVVSMVLTGMVKYTELNTAAPMADALKAVGYDWIASLVSLGALAGLTTVILILMMGQSRVLFAMSRDRLLPGGLSSVHPRYGTPWVISLITGVIVALIATFVPLTTWPTWSTSAPCSPSCWCRSGSSCCAAPSPTCPGPSAPRPSRWSPSWP
jgi:APA family basic amino acid/polyamine antiporter